MMVDRLGSSGRFGGGGCLRVSNEHLVPVAAYMWCIIW